MRSLGSLLLFLGLLVGVAGGAGLMLGLHASGWAWLVTIGLAKLTLLASGGLMAAGAGLHRLARRDEAQELLERHTDGAVR
jgi:hypothetical protein